MKKTHFQKCIPDAVAIMEQLSDSPFDKFSILNDERFSMGIKAEHGENSHWSEYPEEVFYRVAKQSVSQWIKNKYSVIYDYKKLAIFVFDRSTPRKSWGIGRIEGVSK